MSKLLHNNPFGVACILLLVGFFPVIGLVAYILAGIRSRRLLRQQQLQRIMGPGQSYRPIDHVHQIDYHRSGPVVTDAGAIFARCCIAGCEEGIFVSTNVAAVWKMPEPLPLPSGSDLLGMYNGRRGW